MADLEQEIGRCAVLMETLNNVGREIIDHLQKISQQQTIIINELTQDPEDGTQMADCLRQILARLTDLDTKQSVILKHITRTQ